MCELQHLFQHGTIGKMEVKNRIVMSPMLTCSHGPAGEILDKTVNYYEERAKGGIGLIICQSSIIMRESRAVHRASAYDNKFIPGLKRIADVIHKYDAKAAFQVVHHGRFLTDYRYMVDQPEEIKALVPSSTPKHLYSAEIRGAKGEREDTLSVKASPSPIEATKEDIKRVVKGFAEAARRIKDAGFDAVEIHGGHGYLMAG